MTDYPPARSSSVEVRKNYAMPSWAQSCPQQDRLQKALLLADVAAGRRFLPADCSSALVKSSWRFPLPAVLVGLDLGLLLGQRSGRSR